MSDDKLRKLIEEEKRRQEFERRRREEQKRINEEKERIKNDDPDKNYGRPRDGRPDKDD